MTRPLKPLPIVERWDCHGCAQCCHSHTILLTAEDVTELGRQGWDRRPELRGVGVTAGGSWWSGPLRLAQRPNGACVFLTDTGRCRIHEEFGFERKPSVCRQFPWQVVFDDRQTLVTLRRSCPSAAADRGRTVAEQLREVTGWLRTARNSRAAERPPAISRRNSATWEQFRRVADRLAGAVGEASLGTDLGLIRGLRLCRLLEQCRLAQVADQHWPELLNMLSDAAAAEAESIWAAREEPSSAASRLFRRLSGHFVRCVPGGPAGRRWPDRWQTLRAGAQLARGRGMTPGLHPDFPVRSYADLAGPMTGVLHQVAGPLDRFLQTHLVSRQYVLAGRGGPLVAAYRRLALTSPMAWWLWRWRGSLDRADVMVPIVVGLERGFAAATVDYAVGWLSEVEQLEKLIAWYAPRGTA